MGNKIDISYSQLSFFDPTLLQPFNNWTPRHVSQGFSWRPGSVSFRMIEDGDCDVAVSIEGTTAPQDLLDIDAIRAWLVPFCIASHGELEFGSVSDTARTRLRPGDYSLVFEVGVREGNQWCAAKFTSADVGVFRILRTDHEIISTLPLVVIADPA